MDQSDHFYVKVAEPVNFLLNKLNLKESIIYDRSRAGHSQFVLVVLSILLLMVRLKEIIN